MFFCIPKKAARFFIFAAALSTALLCAFLVKNNQEAQAVQSVEWGVHFEKTETAPIPNLSAKDLAVYNAYYCDISAPKKIYLTFDAGYENGNTGAILDALKKHGARAVFFVVGPYIKENPNLILRMVNEGHIVGNHSYSHPDMRKKSKAEFENELKKTEDAYREATGQEMIKVYRPPEGKFTTENLKWASEKGYTTLLWSSAYVDWNTDSQPTEEYAFKKIQERTFDGAIFLLHTSSATNAAILDRQMTKWEEAGYTFGDFTRLAAAQ